MKRWFAAAVSIILAVTQTALAPMGAIAEALDAPAIEVSPVPAEGAALEERVAEQAGVTLGEATELPAGEPERVDDIVSDDVLGVAYGVIAARAALRGSPDGAAFAEVGEGGTALILSRNGDWARIAFNTREGVVEGYLPAASLIALNGAEVDAFMDAVAASGAAALYGGNPDTPLDTLDCSFFEAEAEALAEAEGELALEPEGEVIAEAPAASDAGEATGAQPGDAVVSAAEADTRTAEAVVEEVYEYALDGEAAVYAALSAAPAALVLPSAYTMGLGETLDKLDAAFRLEDGETVPATGLTWSSSKKSCVAVSASTGKLTAKKKGSAVITAKGPDGLTATCKVTVKKAPTKVTLKPATLKLGAGGMSYPLSVTLKSNSASGQISYTSNKPSVASVDDNGVVTTGKKGTATITASAFNGKKATCKVTVYGVPGSVKLSKASLTLDLGDTATLTASALTAAGGKTFADFTYAVDSASPDRDCIHVDAQTGAITAVSVGEALVRATAHNGVYATCAVSVGSAVKSISLPAKAYLAVGETSGSLPLTVVYQNGEIGSAAKVTWSSGNKKVATVNASTGKLKGVKKGTAKITAKTADGLKATCTVTVMNAPTKLTLSPAAVKLSAGGMRFQLSAALSSGASSEVTFTSSNEAVAKVDDDGVITTVGEGSAVITGATFNGKTDTCAVTVTAKPASAAFGKTKLTLGTGESATPEVTVRTANNTATEAELSFRILSGAQYIDLNTTTGEITALKSGTSVISVTTHNGIQSKNTCTITVVESATDISLYDSAIALGVDETYLLDGTVTAPRGSSPTLTWTSSNSKVATVSSSGLVTAKATGSATITVAAGSLKDTCKVTVYKAPTSVTISPVNGSIYVGNSGIYKVSLSSGSAGNCTFKSSNTSIASIDDEGIVTGYRVGKVTITVTTYNGKTATANLTVKSQSGGDNSGDDPGESGTTNSQIEKVIAAAKSQLGMPYVYGGGYTKSNPSGFDCSGLVAWAYYQIGIKLKSSSGKQGTDDTYTKITSIASLKRGDYLCFKSERGSSNTTTHTALYLGGGEFIHASSSAGKVIISSFTTGNSAQYWTDVFLWGRRVID